MFTVEYQTAHGNLRIGGITPRDFPVVKSGYEERAKEKVSGFWELA